ncbi:MAG TPA: PHP-associated domain-containing protein [Bryobacteraceae bacterium]|nr:PHP-associated domain-containing protein [Bryobacteraceae bacterium]
MRCDLHVHTRHSGMCTVPVASAFCRESYTEPRAVYERLKRVGMDLVTITDHDSIDAAEELRSRPDFFLSVEASCTMPSGLPVHIGIYDITDRQYLRIDRLRSDFFSLIEYLNEHRVLFSINHAFSKLTGRRSPADFEFFQTWFPAVEALNGSMIPAVNRAASDLAARAGAAGIGGSDAHTLASAGTAWTRVPAARTRAEFFAGVRAGRAVVEGEPGSWRKLTRDVLSVCGSMLGETPLMALAAPLVLGVPVVTLINCGIEAAFARRWSQRLAAAAVGENPLGSCAWEPST